MIGNIEHVVILEEEEKEVIPNISGTPFTLLKFFPVKRTDFYLGTKLPENSTHSLM